MDLGRSLTWWWWMMILIKSGSWTITISSVREGLLFAIRNSKLEARSSKCEVQSKGKQSEALSRTSTISRDTSILYDVAFISRWRQLFADLYQSREYFIFSDIKVIGHWVRWLHWLPANFLYTPEMRQLPECWLIVRHFSLSSSRHWPFSEGGSSTRHHHRMWMCVPVCTTIPIYYEYVTACMMLLLWPLIMWPPRTMDSAGVVGHPSYDLLMVTILSY